MATTTKKRDSRSRSVIDSSGLFSKGLNTELHEIEDATMYSSEECNCVIRPNGSRSRRLGIDYEEDYKFLPETSIDINGEYAYTAFEWTQIKGASSKRYLVVQAGPKLYFYENLGAPFSQAPDSYVLDLTEFAIEGADDNTVAKEQCRFTQAYGGLFVCSKAVQPFFMESLDKPETGLEQAYSNPYAVVAFGQRENYNWGREYDATVNFYVGGSEVLTSKVGGYAKMGPLHRWVVLDSDGNKVGRVPSDDWEKVGNTFESDVFAMDSNEVVGKVIIFYGLGGFIGRQITAYNSDGTVLGTAHEADDFYRTYEEAQWAWGSSEKVIHKPTASYYVDLWNNYVPVGQTQTAKDRTGLTAYAISPYDGHWDYTPSKKTVPIGSLNLTYNVDVNKDLTDQTQEEFIAFVAEDSAKYQNDISVNFNVHWYKISSNHNSTFERKSYFSSLYRFTNKHGLVLQIRDLKGTTDLYPLDSEDQYNLLEGDNVSVMPEGKLSRAHKYNLYNQGWNVKAYVDTDDDGKNDTYKSMLKAFYDDMKADENFPNGRWPSNSLQWFVGKDSATRSFAEGEIWRDNNFTRLRPKNLLQYAFGDTPAPKGHYILEYFNQDRDSLLKVEAPMTDDEGNVIEEEDAAPIPVEKPRCPYVTDIATYAGRVFYLTGDTVLYSQVILEDLSKASNCYQEADPTSEVISDIVDTDGGMIQIPEIGEGIKLVHIGGTLAVVGTQSTYLISGGSENNFTATAYVGGALQTYSSEAPFSFIEAEGSVFYWSTVGIVQLAPSQGGLVSNVFSQGSIQTFYDNIPDEAKQNCRGFFDNATKELWWLYPGDVNKPRVLNKALVCSLKTSAWTPMEFATDPAGDSTYPFVSGGFSLAEAFVVDYRKPLYAEVQGESVIGSSTWVFPENGGYWRVQLGEDVIGYIYNTQKGYNELVSEPSPAGKPTGYKQFGNGLLLGDKLVGYFGEYDEETKTKPIYDYINVPVTFSLGKKKIDPVIIHDIYSAPTSPATEDGTVIMVYDSKTEVWTNLKNPGKGYDFKYKSRDLATDEFPYDGTLEYTTATPDSEWRIYKGALMYRISEEYNWTRTGTVKERYEEVTRNVMPDTPIEVDTKGYKSSLFICVDTTQSNMTFGVLNNLNYKDWATGDWTGPGYDYNSYLVSHPITLDMPYYNKTIPYLLATFRRTEQGFDVKDQPIFPSACQGAILWDWNTNGDSGKWDAQQELYRYDKGTLLDSKYITSKTRVYGSGRAFQVKLSAVDNKAFDVENVGFQMYVDGRI